MDVDEAVALAGSHAHRRATVSRALSMNPNVLLYCDWIFHGYLVILWSWFWS